VLSPTFLTLPCVIAGLDPAIQRFVSPYKALDARIKSAHDADKDVE
jgi:hypothetical protein